MKALSTVCLWRRVLRCAAVLAALGLPTWAQALCLGPLCHCSVATGTLAFGSLSPLSAANTDASGEVRVSCGGTVGLLIPWKLELGPGSGSVAARRMTGPSATLNYNLYRDAARSVVWGEGTAGLDAFTLLNALGWSADVVLPVYGRIPGGQRLVPPGVYTDTIMLTLTFF
jgi:spore coat protein U-like protein